MSDSSCAVVVTYNRRELLEECLGALLAQTRPLEHVLVVDNASTDGTREMVRERFPQAELLALPENIGGAGGFHEGMKHAHAQGHAWLWIMDDDTIPTPTALEELLRAPEALDGGGPRPLVLASKVLGPDGDYHPFNIARPNLQRLPELVDAAEHGLVLIRYASFVSVLIHRDAIERYGLPIRDFFIWNDDVEFTARVLRHERGYLVPRSVVLHKNQVSGASSVGDRYYYELRNKLQMLRGEAWDPAERTERARIAFTVTRGLAHYLAENRFRPRALRVAARGLADGFGERLR